MVEAGELVLEAFEHRRVDHVGEVTPRGPESDQMLTIELVERDAVADRLLGSRRRIVDRLPDFLQDAAVVLGQGRQVVGDRLGWAARIAVVTLQMKPRLTTRNSCLL